MRYFLEFALSGQSFRSSYLNGNIILAFFHTIPNLILSNSKREIILTAVFFVFFEFQWLPAPKMLYYHHLQS